MKVRHDRNDRELVAVINNEVDTIFLPNKDGGCVMINMSGTATLINDSLESLLPNKHRSGVYVGDTITITF